MPTSTETNLAKTTVYLHRADYRRLKAIARQQGRPAAEVIREAVAEYARKRKPPGQPRSLGAGNSGHGDLAERSEELLAGMGVDR